MLDIKFIRDNPDKVKEGIAKKQVKIDIDRLLALDEARRGSLQKIESLRAEQNKLGKEDIVKAQGIKAEIKSLEPALANTEKELNSLMRQLPNLPLDDVPVGKDERDNVVLREVGSKPKFDFQPKDYMEIAERLGLIDTETAAKVSGTRFGYLKREAVLLEFALINHAFNVLTSESSIKKIADSIKKGYPAKTFIPVMPPVMIKPEVFVKMARLSERDKDERYYLPQDDLYLVGSSEHTLGPMHMDEIIEEKNFPLRYVGFSTCFRREAGAYGKDTRGILRVHQFDKVEMESFVAPENSVLEQNFFVAIQEYLMRSLAIPYQVVMICAGDMGAPDARQVDIEAWMPSQDKYRETHTADLMTDYQSRRLNTRMKRKDNKIEFVHMNDATVLAIGRTLIAIIENYQQKDGSVAVPKVLQKYTGFKRISGGPTSRN